MDRATAISRVTTQSAAGVYPALTTQEIADLVDATVRWTTWLPATQYTFGDVIMPTVRNGHLYRCIVAGTSAGVEPFWPLYTRPDERPGLTRPFWHGYVGPLPGSTVGDGTTLVWVEHGPDEGASYNVKTATRGAWLLKAGKCSADFDVVADNDTLDRSQVHAHCLQMADRYRSSSIT